MARRPSGSDYKQRQAARKKRYAATQETKRQARRKLPWVLGGLVLMIVGFMVGAGLLFYRSTRTLATLTRLDDVVSWVEVRRDNTRYHPYILRLRVANVLMERYLGQNKQSAAKYSYALQVGDSVRVYYDTESGTNLSFIYQLEKRGEVLVSLRQIRREERVMAVGFGLLSLLPLVLLLPNQQFRTQLMLYWMQMMTYFRRRTT